jgi:hypothetical protein
LSDSCIFALGAFTLGFSSTTFDFFCSAVEVNGVSDSKISFYF